MSQPALRIVEGSSMDKSKALTAALSQIERQFGKGSIMRLGKNDKSMDVEAISTGSLGLDAAPDILLLALFPGLIALVLYYLALGRTPASRATLAELAFPLTAALVGLVAFGARPTATQWLGMAIVLAAVVGLALHEQRSSRPSVDAPVRAEDALTPTR